MPPGSSWRSADNPGTLLAVPVPNFESIDAASGALGYPGARRHRTRRADAIASRQGSFGMFNSLSPVVHVADYLLSRSGDFGNAANPGRHADEICHGACGRNRNFHTRAKIFVPAASGDRSDHDFGFVVLDQMFARDRATRLTVCRLTRVAPGCPVPSLMHRRQALKQLITYIGLDVHKETIAVALAEAGKRNEVREYGKIANTPAAV